MFKISLKNVWSRKGRLILTALAVIAGTAFLSGVFVFTDTMKASFNSMFADAFQDTDAFVRSGSVIEGDFGTDVRDRIDQSVIDQVKVVPGVVETEPVIQGQAVMTTLDGKVLGSDGPPKFGMNYSGDELSPFQLVEGAAPGADQVVIDRGSAKSGKLAVGDKISIQTIMGVRQFTISGTVTFAGSDSSLGATWALFDLATAQQFLSGEPGLLDGITVRGDGSVDDTELATRISTALSARGLEVKTGAEITKENQDSAAEVLNVLTIAFSVFALISLFVGSFIIYNVFSISAAQRTQENALLRAVGASRAQVTRSMFVEALVVGIGGSLLGCVGGLGLAVLIMKVMTAAGLMSGVELSVEPTGFVITLIVGVLVTVLCAVVPALRAGRVPPLAAMRDVATDTSDVSRRRLVLGVVVVVAAVASVIAGLGGNSSMLGLGAGLLFLALIVLGPIFAGPFSRAATPLMAKLRPVAGTIAGRNAARNPKRTALTAGALAIVTALFIGVATLGSSAKATTRDLLGETFLSDFTVTAKQDGDGLGTIPPTLSDELAALGVADVMGVGGTRVTIDGKARDVIATDGAAAQKVIDVPFVAGSWSELTASGIIVSSQEAEAKDLQMGSTVVVTPLGGQPTTLTVQGIFDSKQLGRRIVSRDLFKGTGAPVFDFGVWIRSSGPDDARDQIQAVVDKYPALQLQTRDEYVADQSKQIDGFLNLIYGLLGMSMFIAIIGIVITLLLAVYERRRELGLVRAVGMTRRQVRSSILWESMVTAVIGVALGVVLGIALGWIIVTALKDQGLSHFALPVSTVIGAVIGALVLAAVASFMPARRAAKADILQAIATT